MLTLLNLRKSFGQTVAVDDLSLHVTTGEVFGLLGPNGAGKSTTIGMAIGLLTPDSGSVTLEGLGSPTLTHVRQKLGVAPQQLALYDDLSATENLHFFGSMYGLSRSALRDRTSHVLDLVGLTSRASDRVGGFSGGMKRRLNLAAALIHDPPLLLLDEPTAGVDPQSRNNILDLVRHLASEGRTIVYTTHYMEEASKLCDRIGIVDKGKLLALGSPNELIAAHGGNSVVVSRRAAEVEQRIETTDPVREISRLLSDTADASDNAPVQELRVERPDLEAVFLKLTGRSLRD